MDQPDNAAPTAAGGGDANNASQGQSAANGRELVGFLDIHKIWVKQWQGKGEGGTLKICGVGHSASCFVHSARG